MRVDELEYKAVAGPFLHCEPLTDPLAFKRAKDLASRGVTVVFVTNGAYLLRRIEEIVLYPWIQWFISIPTMDDYHGFTGLDQQTLIDGIKEMQARGLHPIMVSAVSSRDEADRIVEALPWLTPGRDIFFSSRDSRAGHVDTPYTKMTLEAPMTKIRYANYCVHPWAFMNVDVDGDVLGCCQDWSHEMIIGNIEDATFQEIYNSPKYRELRRQILDGSYMYKRCMECKKELGYK